MPWSVRDDWRGGGGWGVRFVVDCDSDSDCDCEEAEDASRRTGSASAREGRCHPREPRDAVGEPHDTDTLRRAVLGLMRGVSASPDCKARRPLRSLRVPVLDPPCAVHEAPWPARVQRRAPRFDGQPRPRLPRPGEDGRRREGVERFPLLDLPVPRPKLRRLAGDLPRDGGKLPRRLLFGRRRGKRRNIAWGRAPTTSTVLPKTSHLR